MPDASSHAVDVRGLEVESHFDERAARYDDVTPWVHDERTLAPIAAYLGREPVDAALELGVGSGAVPAYLRRAGSLPPRYVGVDVSSGMLRKALGWIPLRADAAHLPFDDASFDAVVIRQALHYFAAPAAVVAEARRVVRRGGIVVIAQIVAFDDSSDVEWWSQAVTLRQPLRHAVVNPAQIERLICAAGNFRVEDVTEVFGRSSLLNWLARYPIGSDGRQALHAHFDASPDSVRAARRLDVRPNGDFLFSIRWLIWLARAA